MCITYASPDLQGRTKMSISQLGKSSPTDNWRIPKFPNISLQNRNRCWVFKRMALGKLVPKLKSLPGSSPTVDGRFRNPAVAPVEGTVVFIPLFTVGFSTIQPRWLVGIRISEASTVCSLQPKVGIIQPQIPSWAEKPWTLASQPQSPITK